VVGDSDEPEGSDIGGGGTRHPVVGARVGGRANLRAVLRQERSASEPAERWAAALDVSS